MSRARYLLKFLRSGFPHRFFLARLTRLPVLGRMMDYAIFKDDDIIILPSDRTIKIDKKLEPAESVVLPSGALEYFIRKAKYRWIMHRCICRDFSDCKDYPHDYGCIFLGEAAARIDPSLGRMATEEEALEHARKCREAGLIHLMGRDRIDSLWMGVKPANKLLTICHCCPCCCLWKILPDLDPSISSGVTKMPGVEVNVNESCVGCGKCAEVCFVDTISIVDGKAVIGEDCRGCGRCALACPKQAISVSVEMEKGIKEAIERINAAVDVT